MFSSLRRVVIVSLALVSTVSTVSAADVNQSFKDWTPAKGRWVHIDNVLAQVDKGTDCRTFPKLTQWTDYTYELEARRISGSEGFLVMFRSSRTILRFLLNTSP